MKQKFNKRTGLLSFLHDMYLISAGSSISKDSVTGFTVNGENYFDMNGRIYNSATDFVFEVFPDTSESIIIWSLNWLEIPGSRDQLIVNINNLPEGEYALVLTIISGTNEKTFTTSFHVGENAFCNN